MSPNAKKLRTVLASAAISCAAVLAFAWPTATQATGPGDAPVPTAEGTVDPDASQVGPVLASAKLVAHPKYKGMYNLEVTFKNPSDQEPCQAKLDTVLYAQRFSEDSRGGPMPEVAWQKRESLKLAPGQVVSRAYVLPKNLSFRVYQAQAAAKKAEETGTYSPRGVSYYAEVRDAEPPPEETGS
jgi:hypothetical protein